MSLLGEPGNPDREEDLRHSEPSDEERERISGSPTASVPDAPQILDRVTDKVLSYKPKPKSKAAKKRARRKKRKSGK